MTTTAVTHQLDAENPWPGLDPFEESGQRFFYGRDDEAAALLRNVVDSPITVLYGRSGLGKTSLLRAALFPALRSDNYLPIYVRLDFRPQAPSIADQLRVCVRDALESEVPDARLPGEQESIWEYLHRADFELWSPRNFLLTPVIVLDQFEEAFTLGLQSPEFVETFRNDFGDLVENRIPAELATRLQNAEATSADLALRSRNYKLIVSLREDFLPDLESWRHLVPMLGRPRIRLLPMSVTTGLQAVHEPAAHIMSEEQAQRIVRFIAGENATEGDSAAPGTGDTPDAGFSTLSVEPALLSLFCRELNEARKRLGKAQFDEQLIEGAKRDVLAHYYASCIDGLPTRVAHFIETQLITQKGFRNSYARDDAVPSHLTDDELTQLIRSRLVRLEERYGTLRIELSHDVLTSVVREKRDQRQAEEERTSLATRLEIERQKRVQSERAQRRFRLLSVGLAMLLVVASTLGVVSYTYYREAQAQRGLAFARLMSDQAGQIVNRQPHLAILLGLESLSGARSVEPVPPSALVTALARVTHASRQITGHTSAVFGVAFSRDGALLATASGDSTVRLWNAVTGQPHGQPLTGHRGAVWKVAFSPDGTLLATAGDDQTVRLWDTATGQPHGQPLTGHISSVNDVGFSPDGTLLATTGRDRTVRLWDTATGRPHGQPLTTPAGGIYGVAFSRDGALLATAGGDSTVRLWDTATGQPHGQPLTGHTGIVWGVAFSRDGALLATAGGDSTVRLWNTATGQPHGQPLTGHADSVLSVAFSPDGTLLASAGGDSTVRLWDTTTGQPHGQPLTGHNGSVYDITFSPDGKLLASGSDDQAARLWDTQETPSVSTPLVGLTSAAMSVAFSPDGRLLASAGTDGTVRLWDAGTGESHGQPLTGHTGTVWKVTFSPDGKLLATAGEDKTVRLWNTATGQPHGQPLTGHVGAVWSVTFSPDGGLLASVGQDQRVELWDTATGQASGSPFTSAYGGVAFSPDGALLATTSGDQSVRLWDVATGHPYGPPLAGHTNFVNDVAFSPSGKLLASAGDDSTVRLWDTATGQPHGAPLSGHTGSVSAVTFSPNGLLLASAGEDNTVRLWDTATGQPHGALLSGHANYVNDVAFGPDDMLLASASRDRTVRLWHLDFSGWVETGCDLVKRNLTKAEWTQFAADQPYERTCRGYPSGDGAPPDAPAATYAG